MNRGPFAEIDLDALRHNIEILKGIAVNRTIISVVKADAYGHGSVEISKKLIEEGINYLAVAYTGEAVNLRESGINAKIIVLFDRSDIDDYIRYDLIPVIHDMKTALEFSKKATEKGKKIKVHIKIDTGMGRVGFLPDDAVSSAVAISRLEGLDLSGILSHFSEADIGDRVFAIQQLNKFQKIRDDIINITGRPIMAHIANSAAILSFNEALLDGVRPGLAMYGCSPFKETFGLQPVMKVKTEILHLRKVPRGHPISYGRSFVTGRDSLIAVIPVGYADGFNRLFSNNAEVLVNGFRVPVVGRVCMDLTMIDVTDLDNVKEGDEVVLLGQQGTESITASEVASRINTISYEILISFGNRARKVYLN